MTRISGAELKGAETDGLRVYTQAMLFVAGARLGACAEPAPIGQPECIVAVAMTLEEAISGCARIGKRLCSADELLAGVCCGTASQPNKAGCHVLDSALIWSATSCEVPSG